MTSQLPDIISAEQKNMIFENMSDGVITLDSAGRITYCNSACCKILKISAISDILGQSFPELFLKNKKNRAFNKLFRDSMEKHKVFPKTPVRYRFGKEKELHHFNIDISLLNPPKNEIFNPDSPYKNPNTAFNGMVILIEDDTDRFNLRQHEHDCAFIFAGLILCISVFLMSWSLMRFTLHIYLKSSVYTQIIEFITFLLFLEIVFLTSFSMRDIGLIPKISTLKKNIIETVVTALIACCVLLLSKAVLSLLGYQIKAYYIGGSLDGAYTYIFTAFVQEFLARGVIQTSVKSLMKVRFQKFFSIFLTSLLFSLMHMPFGFYFMFGAFMLSLALGYIYERQQNIWGCVILHWCCGYLAMCLYF